LIRRGERYDQDVFANERERIDLLLKDAGYFEFSRQYVEFDVDTSYRNERRVGVKIIVRDTQRKQHKKFVITDVNFVTDATAYPPTPNQVRQTRRVRDINYKFYTDRY